MKNKRIPYLSLLIISIICFCLSFVLTIILIILSNVINEPRPKLAHGMIISILIMLCLSIIIHIISIPYALAYNKYLYLHTNQNNFTLFKIFYVIVAFFAMARWEKELISLKSQKVLKNEYIRKNQI